MSFPLEFPFRWPPRPNGMAAVGRQAGERVVDGFAGEWVSVVVVAGVLQKLKSPMTMAPEIVATLVYSHFEALRAIVFGRALPS